MRIISGTFRGRRLQAPPGQGTRPTTDRVREALFNVLGNAVVGRKVLDCYAGSGALGLEALSRGAQSAVFVEKGRAAADVVRSNLATVGLERSEIAQVIQKPLEKSLGVLKSLGPFDLWLVDPPFAMVRDGSSIAALATLVRAELLGSDGLVVLEYPSDQPCPVIQGLQSEDIRHYGDSRLVIYGQTAGEDGS